MSQVMVDDGAVRRCCHCFDLDIILRRAGRVKQVRPSRVDRGDRPNCLASDGNGETPHPSSILAKRTASSMRHANAGKQPAQPVGPQSDLRRVVARVMRRPYDECRPGRRVGLRGDTTRAPTQGPRPKGGGTMPPCLSPSGLAGRWQNDSICSYVHSTLSPNPWFLGFTLNH
jgi:hypothetical protein